MSRACPAAPAPGTLKPNPGCTIQAHLPAQLTTKTLEQGALRRPLLLRLGPDETLGETHWLNAADMVFWSPTRFTSGASVSCMAAVDEQGRTVTLQLTIDEVLGRTLYRLRRGWVHRASYRTASPLDADRLAAAVRQRRPLAHPDGADEPGADESSMTVWLTLKAEDEDDTTTREKIRPEVPSIEGLPITAQLAAGAPPSILVRVGSTSALRLAVVSAGGRLRVRIPPVEGLSRNERLVMALSLPTGAFLQCEVRVAAVDPRGVVLGCESLTAADRRVLEAALRTSSAA